MCVVNPDVRELFLFDLNIEVLQLAYVHLEGSSFEVHTLVFLESDGEGEILVLSHHQSEVGGVPEEPGVVDCEGGDN